MGWCFFFICFCFIIFLFVLFFCENEFQKKNHDIFIFFLFFLSP